MIGGEVLLALGLGEAFVQLCDPIPEIAFGSDEATRLFHACFSQPRIQVAPPSLDQVRELRGDDRIDAPHVGPHGVELPKRPQDVLPVIAFVIDRMPDDHLAERWPWRSMRPFRCSITLGLYGISRWIIRWQWF